MRRRKSLVARKFSGAWHSCGETRGNVRTGQRRPEERAARARTEEYYERHARMVGGLCLALLRDRAEAEDATQQVFLSAYRALLGGSEPREPPAWLARIARNECYARTRSRRYEPIADADPEAAPSSDPLAEAIRRADLATIWAAVKQLPRQQRDALLLREFGGLSYEELAAALSVTTPAVESLLFRARRSLRARLEPVYGALTGGSWIESIARLFAASAPAAATKAVAIGIGAAAVTGGAVLAPQLVQHSFTPPPPVTTVVAATQARPPATVASPPVVFSAPRSRHARFDVVSERSDVAAPNRAVESGDTTERAGTRARPGGERQAPDSADESHTATAPSAEQESTTAPMSSRTTPTLVPSQQAGEEQETGDGTASGRPSSGSGDN
jgi:RNA polymerase sigma factor (sigma-70 family)